MPVLDNPRHERFCQELAKGKTADEAYVLAGYNRNRGNAGALKAKEHISTRVAEILSPRAEMISGATQKAADGLELTKAWVLARLKENAERALQAIAVAGPDGGIEHYKYEGSVANRALELLGKELGMFIDRKESGKPGDFSRLEDSDLDAEIASAQREIGSAERGNGALN